MNNLNFKSRKPIVSNVVLIFVIILSAIGYLLVLLLKPELYWIIVLVIIDVPIIGYLVMSINSICYTFSNNKLECSWFGGSYTVDCYQIVSYFKYKLPLFEIHLSETNFIGTRITRKNVGNFILLSPRLRTGLIIEIDKGLNNIEKIFITPKNSEEFIFQLEKLLFESFGKKFEKYKNKFYLKRTDIRKT